VVCSIGRVMYACVVCVMLVVRTMIINDASDYFETCTAWTAWIARNCQTSCIACAFTA